jgi:hypothetical protein
MASKELATLADGRLRRLVAAFPVGYDVVISLWSEGAAAPARPRRALTDPQAAWVRKLRHCDLRFCVVGVTGIEPVTSAV